MFIPGLGADVLGRLTALPGVTLLELCGVAFGPSGLAWIPAQDSRVFDLVGSVALVMQLSLSVVAMTVLCVALVLGLMGYPWPVVLVLACIATSYRPHCHY